ncbi:hypothetical protein FB567DRAFT_246731 [Paraphoma chrysanthemicola]|uniref:Secreted protein n=1 Tax=Paraphoma chrysanthemicola TaxID=798071 RepID=A0A8K0VSD2_9PLEO|nr:hypothetical protein FB567DRAFT_246731 [Paraphoma chrysanthemicola]
MHSIRVKWVIVCLLCANLPAGFHGKSCVMHTYRSQLRERPLYMARTDGEASSQHFSIIQSRHNGTIKGNGQTALETVHC